MFNLLKKIAKYAIIFVLALYLAIWALSPYVANHFIAKALSEHQLELADSSSVRYNPFLSKLTLDSLAIHNVSGDVFTLSSLTLQISAYQLLSNEVNVTELLIDGVYIVINKQQDQLQVAGIDIPLDSNKALTAESSETVPAAKITEPKTAAQDSVQASAEQALQLIMPKMRLINSTVKIIEGEKTHTLNIQDLDINVTKVTPSLQNLSLSLLADFNQSDISLTASTDLHDELGDISFDIDVAEIDLHKFNHFLNPHFNLANGYISYQGKHNIKLLKKGLRVEVKDLSLSSQGLELNKNDIHFALGEHAFTSPLLSVDFSADGPLTITGTGDVLWQDVSIFHKAKNQVLVAITELGLNAMEFSSEAGQVDVAINKTSFGESFFSNNTEDEIPALTLFSALTINTTRLTNTALAIDTIDLAGLQSNIQIDKDKQIQNLIITLEQALQALNGQEAVIDDADSAVASSDPVVAGSNKPGESNENTAASESLHITLNRFSLADSAHIQFSDRSVFPNYARYAKIDHLTAGPFDNQQPNQASVIEIKGSSNQYTSFDFTMLTKPFLAQPEYHLKGMLEQMDLESLTPYIKDALGYEIESGQLDLTVDTKLVGSKIAGDSHILLRGIELSSIEDYQQKDSSSQSYIPFNTALGMLKDDNGNVELDLPISGDTSSPSFGLSGFVSLLVKRATIIGAKEYLTMTFVPYAGLVKIAMAADKHLLKIEISDLNYAPTQVDVSAEQEEFVTRFAALLKDKKDLQIKLCGVANAQDIGIAKGVKLTQAQVESVISLADQRGANFKRYMVEEHAIPSSRLLLCKPRMNNSKDSVPHIMFET